MHKKLPEKITHKIEAICVQGCTHVNEVLEEAKNGMLIEELADYSPKETKLIIKELEQIMSVYDDTNCTPGE